MEIDELKDVGGIPEPLKERWNTVIDEMQEACEVELPEHLTEEEEDEIVDMRTKWWEEELNKVARITDKDYRFDVYTEDENIIVDTYLAEEYE